MKKTIILCCLFLIQSVGYSQPNHVITGPTTIVNTNYVFNGMLAKTGADTIIIFDREGTDDGTANDSDIVMRAFTISSQTWGSLTTVHDPGAGRCVQSLGARVVGSQIHVYFAEHPSGDTTETEIKLIKSTDLTASSWGSPTVIYTAAGGAFVQPSTLVDTSVSTVKYLVLAGYETGKKVHLLKSNDSGTTFTAGDVILYGGAANYSEASCVYIGNETIVCHIRDDAGTYVLQSVSTDDGATWSTPTAQTALGASTQQKVQPRLYYDSTKNSLIAVYYDRGDGRLKISVTGVIDALANNWNATENLGSLNGRGYPDIAPMDSPARNFLIQYAREISSSRADTVWFKYNNLYQTITVGGGLTIGGGVTLD